jgi:hypothetical protein
MTAKRPKVLARCIDYNGHPNVLFMMQTDDFRLNGADPNYVVVAAADYNHKAKELSALGKRYRVFSDWSLREINERR